MTTIKRIGVLVLALMLLTTMMAPVVLAKEPYIYRTLEYGDSGYDVKMLQKRLKALGYFDGNIAGNYLDLTVRAMKNFQSAYGYRRTEHCTQKMQQIIQNTSYTDKPYRTLHYGDSGSDVMALQRALKRLGFFHGTLGGNYLDLTRQAVKDFEYYHGYKLTNTCSVSMQRTIRNT